MLGGHSRQRDQHEGIKKKRGIEGGIVIGEQCGKGNDAWLESQQGPP